MAEKKIKDEAKKTETETVKKEEEIAKLATKKEKGEKTKKPGKAQKATKTEKTSDEKSSLPNDGYDSRIVEIRRTTKVREGGRDFSFAAVVVVGDGTGRVGFARGKAKEVVLAVQKAIDKARRNMYKIELKGDTIQYDVKARYGATRIIMRPGVVGTGIIAGGAMRSVFEVLGVKNIIAKCIGSSNPTNVIIATIKSLVDMAPPEKIAAKRGKTVGEILGNK